ncbi:MAG: hypothetical protein AAFY88_29590, partial [Acidobacteriota bacterium]
MSPTFADLRFLRALAVAALAILLTAGAAHALPDLVVSKGNDTGGFGTVDEAFNWTLTVSNQGDQTASISSALFLVDVLPSSSALAFGTPAVTASSGLTGTVSCSISNGAVQCFGFSVALTASGSFTISIPTTASAAGTFTNPGGVCTVDLTGVVAEDDETNNACNSDSVVVTTGAAGPDLTASKSNSVAGATELAAGAFDWTVVVSNGGDGDATFSNGQVILLDNLPSSNVAYGTPSVVTANVSGTVDCSISNSNLTCAANGAVTFTAGTGQLTVGVA